jgi:hypothetical protein
LNNKIKNLVSWIDTVFSPFSLISSVTAVQQSVVNQQHQQRMKSLSMKNKFLNIMKDTLIVQDI